MSQASELERAIFPWNRERKSGPQNSFIKGRADKIASVRSGSVANQAHFYYNLPDGDIQAKSSMSTPAIEEYEVLQTMYKKFGIKPHELEDYDAIWIDKVMSVMSEDHEAQNQKIKQMNNS